MRGICIYLIGVGIFQIVRRKKNLMTQNANVLIYFRHKARNLNEYLHVYPSHSLGKKTTGFSETIQNTTKKRNIYFIVDISFCFMEV